MIIKPSTHAQDWVSAHGAKAWFDLTTKQRITIAVGEHADRFCTQIREVAALLGDRHATSFFPTSRGANMPEGYMIPSGILLSAFAEGDRALVIGNAIDDCKEFMRSIPLLPEDGDPRAQILALWRPWRTNSTALNHLYRAK